MRSCEAFNILALDGGGVRGIYAAHILARLEDTLGTPVPKLFDLIAGTSTGSIIAGAAAANIPMETLVELFESQADRIFGRRRNSVFRSYEAATQQTLSTALSANSCPK